MTGPYPRIHILGASGAGTTTLGVALAERIGAPHFDTDDIFWEPTDPPYQRPRPIESRRSLLLEAIGGRDRWVLSGSLCGWGDVAVPFFDLAVFLWVPTDIRLARLRAREIEKFGTEALAPGGRMHENHKAFMAWAAAYDAGGMDMRSRVRHEAWLADLPCPVVRYEGEKTRIEVLQDLAGRLG